MSARPSPPYAAPKGAAWIALPEDDAWSVANVAERASLRCRRSTRSRCTAPVELVLRREAKGAVLASHRVRWGYCAEHAFGRWADDGEVLHWCLREITPTDPGTPGQGPG